MTGPTCTCHLLEPGHLCDLCRERGQRNIDAIFAKHPNWKRRTRDEEIADAVERHPANGPQP